MTEKIKISIVVPVYQVEKYLSECVESVLNQTYSNLELILIDDGSTDGSSRICDQYSAKDNRIIVVHQENRGQSEARNRGMAYASGEYILFLDSDDLLRNENVISRLVARAKITNADVTSFSFTKFSEDGRQEKPYFSEKLDMPLLSTKREQLEYMINHSLYIACPWNKMVKRSLLNKELLFCRGIYSEDIDWCARLLLKAESFDFIAEQMYSYRQHSSSIRHTINDKKCSDLKSNILKCIGMAQLVDGAEKQALLAYTAFQYGTFFMVQAQAEHVQKDCIAQLAPHQGILKYHHGNKKLLCLHLSCSVLGYQTTCMLIRTLFGRKRG